MRLTLLALVSILALGRPAAALILTGTVLETLDDGTYTFARLDTVVGEKWAAVPRSKLAKGAKIKVYVSANRQPFESKTLKRTFDGMLFGSLESPRAPVTVPGLDPIKVEKASGPDARTVAEVYAQRAELKGKEVLLRAKVMKITPEVMDRNWVHLRDGTGDAKTGDHDLTVTTKETLAVGKVVTVRGTIALNKDMGAGYKFPVLLEGAKLAP
ncbi:MAG: nucleotide-binding protein [Elusimicrobia bacterium]|nr:nucleotide-binding protein [Elusimicrobiota bacterium]